MLTHCSQLMNKKNIVVEALQHHSNTQSHWSIGSTICFPPRGQWFVSQGFTRTYNATEFSCWRCMATLVTPMWSLITGYNRSFARDLTMTLAAGYLSHAFPGSIPLLTGPPPPPCTSDRLNPWVKLLGGAPCRGPELHSNTQSHWSSC